MSGRPLVARSRPMFSGELPNTKTTLAPVAFSKGATWHTFDLSAKEPPKIATTSSCAWIGAAIRDVAATQPATPVQRMVISLPGPERATFAEPSSGASLLALLPAPAGMEACGRPPAVDGEELAGHE